MGTLLGICGRKQHGKDTFASMLVESVPGFERLSFAWRLKEICMAVFGLSLAQVNDDLGKDMAIAPVNIDLYLSPLRKETGLDLRPLGLVAGTPRRVLQLVGTDYVRAAEPLYWIRKVAERIDGSGPDSNFVVTDVRFANEAQIIRQRGGKVVKILRLSKAMAELDAKAEHASEELDFAPDFTLAVNEGDYTLSKVACRLAARGLLFDGLQAFNWDHLTFAAPIAKTYYREQWPAMSAVALSTLFGEEAA